MSGFDWAQLTDEERDADNALRAYGKASGEWGEVVDSAIVLGVRIGRRLERGELLGGPDLHCVEVWDDRRGIWMLHSLCHATNDETADELADERVATLRDEGRLQYRHSTYVRVPDDGGEGAGS